MKKIVIFNQKGGTGKTATSVSLSHGLALKGKHVLLIDFDPQNNSGMWVDVNPKYTLYDLLMNEDTTVTDCIVSSVRENLDLIAGEKALTAADLSLVGEMGREQRFSQKMERIENYDYVIMDCPPNVSVITQNALIYCDYMFVPVTMDHFSLDALNETVKDIGLIKKKLGKQIELQYVIPTFYEGRTRLAQVSLEALHEHYPNKVTEPIRKNQAIKDALSNAQTIFEYDPGSNGAKDYQILIDRVYSNE